MTSNEQECHDACATTLNIVLSVTYYLDYMMLYLFTIYLIFYQQMLNWLFEHYRTSTTTLDRKLHQQ